jgi:hypothetical protein
VAALAFRAASIFAIIASISAEQGPAKVADIDAVNITALNANIVAIFMASSSCSVGITNNFTLLRPKTIPLTEIKQPSGAFAV